MPGDSSNEQNVWPLPKFSFQVQWESVVMSFQEVSGLDSSTRAIEYRGGNSRDFSATKMPAVAKYGNVTMKKGLFKGDSTFWDWYKLNNARRSQVSIRLLDQSGAPTMTWQLSRAFPVKVSAADLKSTGNEVAIETLEIAHEGLTVANG